MASDPNPNIFFVRSCSSPTPSNLVHFLKRHFSLFGTLLKIESFEHGAEEDVVVVFDPNEDVNLVLGHQTFEDFDCFVRRGPKLRSPSKPRIGGFLDDYAIYIPRMPHEVTEENLLEVFSKYGYINDTRIQRKSSYACGHVFFDDNDAAKKVLEIGTHEILKTKVSVLKHTVLPKLVGSNRAHEGEGTENESTSGNKDPTKRQKYR